MFHVPFCGDGTLIAAKVAAMAWSRAEIAGRLDDIADDGSAVADPGGRITGKAAIDGCDAALANSVPCWPLAVALITITAIHMKHIR